MLSLTLTDFQTALPFSDKIESGQVLPFVDLSLRLDLQPLLGFAVLEAVDALPAVPAWKDYADLPSLKTGDFVLRRQRVFKVLVDGPATVPPPASVSTSEWAYQPLLTLWSQYLQPYWLRASFARFLAQHGANLTKAGITNPNDPQGTFVRASSADKASLQAAADSTTEAMRSQLTAFRQAEQTAYGLDATTGYDYGLTATTCGAASHAAPRARLRGINSHRPRPRWS